MSSLYHYCSVETLKCILSNKTLRLSDIRKSNDPKEIEFLFEKYQNWNLKKHNYSDTSQHNNKVLDVDKIIQLKNETFLVLCLSKTYDTLAMWNRYACKGVAIEFDETELTSLTEQDMEEILFVYGVSNVEIKKSRGIFR